MVQTEVYASFESMASLVSPSGPSRISMTLFTSAWDEERNGMCCKHWTWRQELGSYGILEVDEGACV